MVPLNIVIGYNYAIQALASYVYFRKIFCPVNLQTMTKLQYLNVFLTERLMQANAFMPR